MDKDLVIIGGGPGGYVAAIRAAQLGAKVALVEQDKLGGTCLNRGCIPTKALYKNAEMLYSLNHAENFGISLSGYSFDFKSMQERKLRVVNQLAGGIVQLLKANRVEVIKGKGYISDKETVVVVGTDAVESIVKTKNILIATGSIPAKPPIPGLELMEVMTSDEVLELEKIPSSIVIIGGGVIGIEFAGILNALGTDVTIVEFLPNILPNMDTDISKRLTLSLKKKGIKIETSIKVKEVRASETGLTVIAEGKNGDVEFNAERVIVSTGRAVNVEGLNLQALGIEHDKKGIKVDENFQTSVSGIYAIGDVIGGQMLAHVASDEGKAAVENMMGLKGHINYNAVPSCVFTFPEVAAVGFTEDELKQSGQQYITSKFMFGANGKALTMGEEEGFVKVIASAESKELIGVHIMGPHASDLIHEAVLAIENKLSVENFSKIVHAHPTLSEAFYEAVMGLDGRAVHMAPMRIKK